MKNNTSVWFITGSSSGLGLALAHAVLDRGGRAVVTAREPSAVAELAQLHGDNALALRLDVTDKASIEQAVAVAEAHFGQIDVLVNAAGYGYLAAIEEGEDSEVRAQFETNVFGLLNVTKRILPGMRKRRRGHIVNISSLGGLVAFPATGYYHATKFAIEALSESLAGEVAPLGINTTIIEPGAFRTDWAGRSMVESKIMIDDYAESAGRRRTQTRAVSGKQPGDPARAATAIIRAVESETPPLRLLLGTSAYTVAMQRLDTLHESFEAWRETTCDTDFQVYDDA